jgi:MatE
VRVSNELGAGNPKSASFSVVVVTTLSFIIVVILSVIILFCRNYISYIFTEGEEVSDAVAGMTPLLAGTLILNGIQPVLSGVFSFIFYLPKQIASSNLLCYFPSTTSLSTLIIHNEYCTISYRLISMFHLTLAKNN